MKVTGNTEDTQGPNEDKQQQGENKSWQQKMQEMQDWQFNRWNTGILRKGVGKRQRREAGSPNKTHEI